MPKAISLLKEERRKLFRAKIRDKLIKNQSFEKASTRLSNLLDQLDLWKEGLTVASYRPLPGELSADVFQKKYQHKCCFVFPKIKEELMSFVAADLYKEEDWEKSTWGGRQPSGDKNVPLSKINIFFVPALAFDRRGRRLGRGKGFYDRILSQTTGIKIGLAGVHQVSNEDLPEQKQDVRVDAVVTEHFAFFPIKEGFLTKTGVKVA